MHLTQAEIIQNLNLDKIPAIAVPTAFGQMELGLSQLNTLFRQFAGEGVEPPPSHLVETTVCYLVYDAARKQPLDIAGAIARTERLAAKMPGSFTVSASQLKAEARDNARAERMASLGVVTPGAGEHTGEHTGEPKRRGRKAAAPGESNYDRVKAMMEESPGVERDTMIARIVDSLGVAEASAKVYWYKAKKEAVA